MEYMMKTKPSVLIGSLFATISIPYGLYMLAGFHQGQIEQVDDEDKIKEWRKSRLYYRAAQILPWLWKSSSSQIVQSDAELSSTMYKIILEGSSGSFTSEQHLSFLQSREILLEENKIFWAPITAEAEYRYGEADNALKRLEEIHPKLNEYSKEQQTTIRNIGMLSSMHEADLDSFDLWYSEEAPAGYAFFSSSPKGAYKDLIETIQNGGIGNWETTINDLDPNSNDLPYWIEGLARFGMLPEKSSTDTQSLKKIFLSQTQEEQLLLITDVLTLSEKESSTTLPCTNSGDPALCLEEITASEEQLTVLLNSQKAVESLTALNPIEKTPLDPNAHTNLIQAQWKKLFPTMIENGAFSEDLASNLDQWQCALLASAPYFEQSLIEPILLKHWQTSTPFVTRMELPQKLICHPDVFSIYMDKNTSPTLSTEDRVWLLLNGVKSHLGLYNISAAQSLLKKIDAQFELTEEQKVFGLYLRVLCRELAGDVPGMEKYAQIGLELDKSLFTVVMGKSALIKQQKKEAVWLLYGVPDLKVPGKLMDEYNDLCALAQRLNGSAIKIELSGELIPYGMLERSTDFRAWFAKKMNTSTLIPHPVTPYLPLLINNPRAEKDGIFLLSSDFSSTSSYSSIIKRFHHQFLFKSFRENSVTDVWSAFSSVQKLADKLTFPQMTFTNPELFLLNLPTVLDDNE